MNSLLRFSAPLAALLFGVTPSWAASKPVIQGHIAGIELAPQFLAGAATFAGAFEGQVGKIIHATGVFVVSVNHEALPDPDETAAITGGTWRLNAGGKTFRGTVKSGSLYNNGDDTFAVVVVLQLTQGGTGVIYFQGILDHRPFLNYPPFVPTLVGDILQNAP